MVRGIRGPFQTMTADMKEQCGVGALRRKTAPQPAGLTQIMMEDE